MVLFLDFQFNVTLFVQLLLQLRLPPPLLMLKVVHWGDLVLLDSPDRMELGL